MKKEDNIGIIPGDEIGRDVVEAAPSVLAAVNRIPEEFTLTFFKMDAWGLL